MKRILRSVGAWGARALPLLLVALFLAGCDRIPQDLQQRAKAVPERIADLAKVVGERQTAFNGKMKSANGAFFKPYADREKWEAVFSGASADLTRAKAISDGNVKKYLDAGKSENAPALKTELDRIDSIVKGANESTRNVASRMGFLENAKENEAKWVQKAHEQMSAINAIISSIAPVVSKAQADYSARDKDILGKYAPLTAMQDAATAALVKADAEHAKVESRQPFVDYAVLGDNTTLVGQKLEELQKADKELRDKLGELYKSYTKILADMRVEYWVTVGRTSWDESSDFASEHAYQYAPVQVDEDTYNTLSTKFAEATLGSYGCWGLCTPKVSEDIWAKLGLNTKERQKEKWPTSWDDSAEFWLADADAKYFHKYILVNNGQRTETDWIEVDDEEFDEYVEALGMEIESKPYGAFESEKDDHPAPPGLSLVGNPQYGQWKENPTTRQREWSWLETYAFYNLLFGGNSNHYYYGSDYDNYRNWRNSKDRQGGYYGGSANAPVYGTNGTLTRRSTTFGAGSTFARTGGFHRAAASVRTAGPSNRARGPGGGGK